MDKNFSKTISKVSFYGCWVAIIIISFIYGFSSYAVNSSSIWPERILHEYALPEIDPLIHVDTKYYVLPQKISGNSRIGLPPNEYLVEKAKNFYSGVGVEFYTEVFYRPDFDQFPVETSLILLFRLLTYAGIVLFFFLLSKILKTVVEENPFDQKNHMRLFYMGIIAVFLPIIITVHSVVMAGFIRYDPKLIGYEISPSYLNLWLVFIGVFIIVLSFFLKETARIYEEQKLTV